MSPSEIERRVKAIEKLKRSDGWALLRETMEREIVDAAKQIASNRLMSVDETNFRRGAIWAADQLLQVPERILNQLDLDLALARSASAEQGSNR